MILDKIGRESVERRGFRVDFVDGEWQKGVDSVGEREAVREIEIQYYRGGSLYGLIYICNENFNFQLLYYYCCYVYIVIRFFEKLMNQFFFFFRFRVM